MNSRLSGGSGGVSIRPATGFNDRLPPAPSRSAVTTPRTSRGPSGAATTSPIDSSMPSGSA